MARKQPIEMQEITYNDVKPGQIIKVIDEDLKFKYYLIIKTKRHINLVEILLDQHFIYDEEEFNKLYIRQVFDSKTGNCIIYESYEKKGEKDNV